MMVKDIEKNWKSRQRITPQRHDQALVRASQTKTKQKSSQQMTLELRNEDDAMRRKIS